MSRKLRFIHLEDLLGRGVLAEDGRRVGRIEEIRAERRGDDYEVTEYLLGPGALVERLSIVHRLLGRQPRMSVARWNQIDITAPGRPRLTCPFDELEVKR